MVSTIHGIKHLAGKVNPRRWWTVLGGSTDAETEAERSAGKHSDQQGQDKGWKASGVNSIDEAKGRGSATALLVRLSPRRSNFEPQLQTRMPTQITHSVEDETIDESIFKPNPLRCTFAADLS